MPALHPRATLPASLVAWSALLMPSAFARQAPSLPFAARFDTDSAGFMPYSSSSSVTVAWSRDGGRDDSGALHIKAGAGASGMASWTREVATRLDEVEVRVTAWIRGRGVSQPMALNVQAFGEKMGQQKGMAVGLGEHVLRGDFEWTRIEAKLRAAKGTVGLFLALPLSGPGEVWFDDLSIELAGATVTAAPGLFEVSGAYRVRAKTALERPALLFPVPLPYRDQCPLSFEVRATPEGAIESTRFLQAGDNVVAEVVLGPLAEEAAVELSWTSLVLCGPSRFPDLPASLPLPASWPDEVVPWLQSSLAVTCADPRFTALGGEIAGAHADVVAILERALARKRAITGAVTGAPGHSTALDALEHPGSCTSAANLLAALLRASGVPARVLGGYPTTASPLQTHYVVEAFVPGFGWRPIEATTHEHPLDNMKQIIVSIVPVEHEDLALARPTGGLGVPYLSLTEAPECGADIEIAGGLEASGLADHVASPLRNLTGEPSDWSETLKRARERFAVRLSARSKAPARGGLVPPPGACDAASLAQLIAALAAN